MKEVLSFIRMLVTLKWIKTISGDRKYFGPSGALSLHLYRVTLPLFSQMRYSTERDSRFSLHSLKRRLMEKRVSAAEW